MYKNKTDRYKNQMERWKLRKINAIVYLGSKCVDCSLALSDSHPSVFDFHHIDPKSKVYDWNKLRLRNQTDINNELDKCVLLCANCHRIRHALFS